MNTTVVKSEAELEALLNELTDYKRLISYNLSELLVVRVIEGWRVYWRQDGRPHIYADG